MERIASDITTRESMIFLDGVGHQGGIPGLRNEAQGDVMLFYLTDVRRERVVVVGVIWSG